MDLQNRTFAIFKSQHWLSPEEIEGFNYNTAFVFYNSVLFIIIYIVLYFVYYCCMIDILFDILIHFVETQVQV